MEALDGLCASTTLTAGAEVVPLCAAAARGHQGDWEGALRVLSPREELEWWGERVIGVFLFFVRSLNG